MTKKVRTTFPYLFTLPAIALVVGVLMYPWAQSFVLSFTKFRPMMGIQPEFLGLQNYLTLFHDPVFKKAIWVSFVFAGVSVFLECVFGMLIALLFTQVTQGLGLIRTCLLIPMMIAPALSGLIWKLFLNAEFGFVNYFIGLFGLPGQLWLSSEALVLPSIILVDVWRETPFVAIFMYAGLQALPPAPFEAARIDGASAWQVWRYITFPLLRPLIGIVVLFRLIFALRIFDIVFVLAREGGPDHNAMVLGMYLYERTYKTFYLGLGSAVSFIILAFTLILGFTFVIFLYREVEF